MIKRCPTCNRTYSDESISFCLADGALLSAPYDTPREEPPLTEVLPSPPAPIPPTSPPKQTVPTMTGWAGAGVSPFEADKPQPKRPGSSSLMIWAAVVFVIVGAIVIGIFGVRRVLNRQTQPAATSSPEPALAQHTSSPTDSSQVTTTTTSAATETSRPTVNANQSETKMTSSPQAEAKATSSPATAQVDPVLFPPDSRQTPETKEPAATDYDRIFRRSEVDSPVRIVSRPVPSYTESARKNQVVGVVVLRTVFTSSGSVTNVSVIRGLPDGLSERAIASAKQIKFTPAMKDGRPVSTWVQLEYNFNLY